MDCMRLFAGLIAQCSIADANHLVHDAIVLLTIVDKRQSPHGMQLLGVLVVLLGLRERHLPTQYGSLERAPVRSTNGSGAQSPFESKRVL